MTSSPTTRRIIAGALALTAWVGGTVAGALGGTAPAIARPTFQIGRAHGAYLPITDPERPIFLLLIGSDARPGTSLEEGLADSLHILGINVAAKRATLYGLPRDSYVPIASGGSNKINTAMSAGGPENQVATVEALTGIPIDYWVVTGFTEFSNFVRSIDGVTVQNPYAFSGSNKSYPAGEIVLDGPDALSFARERKGLPSGDFHRSWNQGLILEGFLQQFRGDFGKDQAATYEWLGSGLQQTDTDGADARGARPHVRGHAAASHARHEPRRDRHDGHGERDERGQPLEREPGVVGRHGQGRVHPGEGDPAGRPTRPVATRAAGVNDGPVG